jgi:transcription initiation factor TFIID subunit 7
MIKPTLKLRDDQDDADGSGDGGGYGEGSSSQGMRMRVKPNLRRPSGGSSLPGAVTAKSRRARRLRLNINHEQRIRGRGDPTYAGAKKTIPYMQGYDRELDSSDDETGEGMAFEEHIILRMPEGNETSRKLTEWVRRREAGSEGHEVELKFKDSRRAVFKVGTTLFSARLVDLPAIIETHKTLDNKQLFKICDISQMLLVTHQVDEEADVTKPNPVPIEGLADNFVYDHGITPPMRWARKRRFRKRVHKRTIETVENEVERLLAEDERAEKIEYKLIDLAEADLSDTDSETGGRRGRRPRDSSVMEDGASTIADGDDRSIYDDFEDGSMMADDDDVDRDLQRELEEEMMLQQEEEDEEDEEDEDDDGSSNDGASRRRRARSTSRATSDDDDDDDDDDEEDDLFDAGVDDAVQAGAEPSERDLNAPRDDDDDDDDDLDDDEAEMRVREQQLEAECREIENMVKRKQAEVDSTANALIKQRNQASLKRIQAELELRRTQLHDLKQQRRDGKAAAKAEAKAHAEEEAAAAAAALAADAVEPTGSNVAAEEAAIAHTASTDSASERRNVKSSSSTITSSPGKRASSATAKGVKGVRAPAAAEVEDAEVANNDDDEEDDGSIAEQAVTAGDEEENGEEEEEDEEREDGHDEEEGDGEDDGDDDLF